MSDERPPRTKSWREIDRGRDRSAQRREERPAGGPGDARRRERSMKTYRAALDRAFERGLAGVAGGDTRLAALAAIRDGADDGEITRAVDAYREKFGELPDEVEVWAQAAFHRDEARAAEAIARVGSLLETKALPRKRALCGRLRYLEDLAEDVELRAAAAALRKRLGG